MSDKLIFVIRLPEGCEVEDEVLEQYFTGRYSASSILGEVLESNPSIDKEPHIEMYAQSMDDQPCREAVVETHLIESINRFNAEGYRHGFALLPKETGAFLCDLVRFGQNMGSVFLSYVNRNGQYMPTYRMFNTPEEVMFDLQEELERSLV